MWSARASRKAARDVRPALDGDSIVVRQRPLAAPTNRTAKLGPCRCSNSAKGGCPTPLGPCGCPACPGCTGCSVLAVGKLAVIGSSSDDIGCCAKSSGMVLDAIALGCPGWTTGRVRAGMLELLCVNMFIHINLALSLSTLSLLCLSASLSNSLYPSSDSFLSLSLPLSL